MIDYFKKSDLQTTIYRPLTLVKKENEVDDGSAKESNKCTKSIINPFYIFHTSSFHGH